MTQVSIPLVPKPTTLALFEKPIAEAQDLLKNNLAWLSYSFGKSQRLVKKRNSKEYHYPGIYISAKQYIDMHPSIEYGNYSFFILDTTQELRNFKPNSYNEIRAKCSIVFWFDLDQIYTDSLDRSLEPLKAEILDLLTRNFRLKTGRFEVSAIYEKAEDIYKEYSVQEIDTQFLMQPCGGLRFEGLLTIRESC